MSFKFKKRKSLAFVKNGTMKDLFMPAQKEI